MSVIPNRPMKIVAIVQARLDSSRLPGKVLKEIEGEPALFHIVERLKASKLIHQVVVATSDEDNDQLIRDFCEEKEIAYYAGSKDDVLDRYYRTAQKFSAEMIVRITGDSPLIDPQVTDKTIKYFLDNKFDYVCNTQPPTYPDGLDTEVFPFLILEEIWRKADKQYQREHVTPFIIENKQYKKGNVTNEKDLSHLRWTLDYEEDLDFIRKVFQKLKRNFSNLFTMGNILDLLESNPELLSINNQIKRNDGFKKSLSKEGVDSSLFKDYFKQGLIESERLYLRQITLVDANDAYLSWLQDPEVSQHLDSRFHDHSLDSLQEYVLRIIKDPVYIFLAVISKENNQHIGNIKIGPIDMNHHHGYLGIMIGDKRYWGQGYGTEAIKLAAKYALQQKDIHKVLASIASNHSTSMKAFEKAGFKLEGELKECVFFDGKYYDKLIYGITEGETMINEETNINKKPNISKSLELWQRGEQLIPCGTQTASKGPDQFVRGVYPIYIQKGQGSHVYDVDGNEYIDYPCSLGVIILGHSYPAVVEAIWKQAAEGITFSLMHPLEVEVAEMLTSEIPCAESVRFVKNGSDATSAAVRLARAHTGRDKIVSCGYHGWQDWYVISTEKKKGVPLVLEDYIIKFDYNDLSSLKKAFEENKDQIAAVIMEPIIMENPQPGFLEGVKQLAHDNGALLIFDEMVTGFRFGLGGAQKYFNVIPDLGCFGKCVANGMPLSIVTGKKEIMDQCKNIFLSVTFGGEAVSLAAAKCTLKEIKEKKVVEHIWQVGKILQDGLKSLISEFGIKAESIGQPPRQNIVFKDDSGYSSAEIKTLFLQETIKRGVLIGNVILLTYSHSEEDIKKTLDACRDTFRIIKAGLDQRNLRERLEGEVKSEVFRQKAEK